MLENYIFQCIKRRIIFFVFKLKKKIGEQQHQHLVQTHHRQIHILLEEKGLLMKNAVNILCSE